MPLQHSRFEPVARFFVNLALYAIIAFAAGFLIILAIPASIIGLQTFFALRWAGWIRTAQERREATVLRAWRCGIGRDGSR